MATSPKRASRPAPGGAVPEKLAGVGTAAVQKATGKTWAEWRKVLDADGASALSHKDIALRLHQHHGVSEWWAQMVTVGYEQAIGRRVVGQKCSGDFSASASKTLPLSAAELHAWFSDTRKRNRWLGREIVLRTATAPRSARLGFPDGSIAGAWITAKGDAKSSLGISHDGLPDARTAEKHKTFWQAALGRLTDAAVGAK